MKRYFKRNFVVFTAALLLGVLAWGMMTGSAIFQQILVDDIVGGDTDAFISNLILAGGFAVILGVVYYFSAIMREKFTTSFDKSMRGDVYNGIMRRSKTDFDSKDTAAYVSNVYNDARAISSIMGLTTGYVFSSLVSSAVALIIMLTYSFILTAIAVGAAALSLVIPIIFTKPMQKRQKEISDTKEAFTTQMKEIFQGRDVVTSLNLFEKFRRHFERKNTSLMSVEYKLGKLRSGSTSIMHSSSYVTRIVMILAAGFMVLNGSITLGTLVLFTALAQSFAGGFSTLMQMLPHIKGIKPVWEKLEAIIDYEDNSFTGDLTPAFENKLEIKGLNFRYNENLPVITDMDLTIHKNEKIALIGPSGCGKTTLMKLLRGEYANYEGEISYDGQELKKLASDKMHKILTIIQQNVYIFNETIRYNICLDEEFSQTDLERALRLSGVDKFLADVPNGLDGQCGEKGTNLSGGQRQRIAIARALIRGVKFIVLDEGVSAIDIETANEIEQELLNIPDLTLVTITHRIKDGLIDKYDRIIDMADIVKGELAKPLPVTKKPKAEKADGPISKMLKPGQSLADLMAELEEETSSMEEAEKMLAETQAGV